MKKYLAELIGTAILVTAGCGTAMLVGCSAVLGGGYILTALAFGLALIAAAYSIGNVSGCHINPAVSLGMLIAGRMSVKDFIGYVIAQVIGAFAGIGILAAVFSLGNVTDMTEAFGANGLSGVNGNIWSGLIIEIVLSFIFVAAVMGVTSKKMNHGHTAGIVIGLTLVLVHVLGIGFTGTSVNPARSIAPAFAAMFSGNGIPMESLWIFIVAPLIGGALAAIVQGYLESDLKPAKS